MAGTDVAKVEVRDRVLWTKHIHGDDDLRGRLQSLPAGASVRLKVADQVGYWRKMNDNRTTGKPTPGLSPIGPMLPTWGDLFRANKDRGGTVVDLEWVPETGQAGDTLVARPMDRWEVPGAVEREAAWAAFLRIAKEGGWRSEEPYGPRDELYDGNDR